ncbi:MAG TPA: carboxypeptidase-like regulatory domain-containing protein, partial [Cyclobacteriaceae bacterium]
MKKILLLLCAIGISWGLYAQEITVSGRVTSSEDGSALPGVNVLLKGTTNGTATDADGKYSLSVPSTGGVLIFSFIGLKTQEISIDGRTTIDIGLSLDATELSEVVVTAMGIERSKNELAYAAQKVDGEALSQTRDNNFVNALSGKVAGVDIKRTNSMGGSTNVVIRGFKSITGNNQALFIVDGVPIDNSNTNGANQQTGRGGYDFGNAAADINPDDIASVNVLKGAAATSLYGSRAANGVVMITTKKGKGNKGVGVTLNAGVTVGSIDKSTFAEYQNKYGQGYGPYYEDPTGSFLYRYNSDWSSAVTSYDADGVPDGWDPTGVLVSPFSEDASYGAAFDPNLMVYQWESFDPLSPVFGQAQPWDAAKNDPSTFFETPVATNYSVLLDGQTDKGYFKLGYTANDENGIMPGSSLNKDFFNLGASYKITEKLTASSSLNISNIEGKGRYGSGYDDKNLMTNFRQWWHVGIDLKEQETAYWRNRNAGGTGNVTWNWADPTNLTPIYWDNPYFTRYEN